MPLTITVLLYESDRTFEQIPFILKLLMGHWETFGHHIRVQRGLVEPLHGDVVIPHLSLTQIPQPYHDCLQAHPRVLNRRLMDTSKRQISQHLLAPGDSYQGPVIVKTNANYGGRDEQRLGLGPTPPAFGRVGRPWRRFRRWLRLDANTVDWRRVTSLDPNHYPLFPNLAAVPRPVFANPHLIVEKFLPERKGDWYCLRNWTGLGDVGENVRAFSKLPIVKAAVAFGHTPISMPAELTAWRQAIGMDYGKIDYVMPAGRLVIPDVNPTPTYGGSDPHPSSRPQPNQWRRPGSNALTSECIFRYSEGIDVCFPGGQIMDTSTQCACPNCICPVSAATAVVVEGKLYCSETCAQGHPDGHHGCGHTGCHC